MGHVLNIMHEFEIRVKDKLDKIKNHFFIANTLMRDILSLDSLRIQFIKNVSTHFFNIGFSFLKYPQIS